MKQFLSRLLIAALLLFLFSSNPTTEEFAHWYVSESFSDAAVPVPEVLADAFAQHLADGSQRSNYLLCSVFTYNGSMTLGIGNRFFPVAELSQQFEALQSEFSAWAEQYIG